MDPHACGGDTPAVAADQQHPAEAYPNLAPVVSDVDGADPERVEAGRAYWAWDGLHIAPDDVRKPSFAVEGSQR